MLRKFTTYRPQQIAKFVLTLFKGTFSIEGIGVFYFDKGRVLLPDLADRQMLTVRKEINLMIDSLSPQLG